MPDIDSAAAVPAIASEDSALPLIPDEQLRTRRGDGHAGPTLPPDQLRRHSVNSRYSEAEHARLVQLANQARMKLGEFQRVATLNTVPVVIRIPELNQSAWVELSRLAANLNQIVRLVHDGKLQGVDAVDVSSLSNQVAELRRSLIGSP